MVPTLTDVTPVSPLPVRTTPSPALAFAGAKDVSFGRTLKLVELEPEPEGVTTVTGPGAAFGATTAVTDVLVTVTGAVVAPPKSTPVAPANVEPLIVTLVPTAADEGETAVTLGVTRN